LAAATAASSSAAVDSGSTEIQDLQRRLANGAAGLSREETARLQRELEQKTIDGQRLQDDANRELKRRQERTAEQIEGRVMPMIETLGKELGFHMILRKFESGLLYADESLDITDELIQRLDGGT
jgi:outer membrane protein